MAGFINTRLKPTITAARSCPPPVSAGHIVYRSVIANDKHGADVGKAEALPGLENRNCHSNRNLLASRYDSTLSMVIHRR